MVSTTELTQLIHPKVIKEIGLKRPCYLGVEIHGAILYNSENHVLEIRMFQGFKQQIACPCPFKLTLICLYNLGCSPDLESQYQLYHILCSS